MRRELVPRWKTPFILGPLGFPPTPLALMYLCETAKHYFGDNFTWQAAATDRYQLSMCAMALAMGGNVRVGMEGSLYAGSVLAKSNADQVEKIVHIAKELSIDIATPDEARQILGLKGLGKVNY